MFFPLGVKAVQESTEQPISTSGLPRETLVPILRSIRGEIQEIRDAIADIELRMVGGSLLIIYEADWDRAAEGIKKYLSHEEEEDDEDEDDEDEDNDSKPKAGPPFVVKLIDFAHTLFVPGQGPDEGVLKGIDTVLNLLDGRLKDLAVFS